VGPGSYNYNLLSGGCENSGSPPLRPNWLWCINCRGLYHANSGTNAGVCPINFTSKHEAAQSYRCQMFVLSE
jgi:hypothetical protein